MKHGSWKQGTAWTILAVAMVVSTDGSVQADPVTYYTTGTSGINLDAAGGILDQVQINYTGVGTSGTPITVTAPGNGAVGSLYFNNTSFSGFFNSTADFDLTVHQSVPSMGTGVLGGDLTGTAHFLNPNTVTLTFTNVSISIGGVTYQLETKNGSNFTNVTTSTVINLGQGSGNAITLYAAISGSGVGSPAAAPEPSTVAMALSGLVAIGFVKMRRRRVS